MLRFHPVGAKSTQIIPGVTTTSAAPPAPPTPLTPSPLPPPNEADAPQAPEVVVNIPEELLEFLQQQQSGLPESTATIVAACIAVVAALIALSGVGWQIRAASREARADRVTDARIARQSQLVERMADALGLSRALEEFLNQNRGHLDDWSHQAKHAFSETTQRSHSLTNVFIVLGAEESGAALHRLTYLFNIMANSPADTAGEIGIQTLDGKSDLELSGEMLNAFQRDLELDQTERR